MISVPDDLVVETLLNEMQNLSPDNEWVMLSVLTERSSVDIK